MVSNSNVLMKGPQKSLISTKKIKFLIFNLYLLLHEHKETNLVNFIFKKSFENRNYEMFLREKRGKFS